MLWFRLGSTMLLAATILLINAVPESQSGKVLTVACEGSVAQLKCVQGQVISVQSAVYGRRDKTTCATKRPASQIQNVRCSAQSKTVAESCNGKSSCSINARNSVFGDPCRGTYKYLEVDYTCQLPESRSGKVLTVACEGSVAQLKFVPGSFSQEVVICEGKTARLKCGKTQGIYVYKAIYGRSDQTTCARLQPAWKIKNVNCSRSSTKVAERCNGKRSCAIRARNSVFGDPCVGTYKYLKVVYTCYARVTG